MSRGGGCDNEVDALTSQGRRQGAKSSNFSLRPLYCLRHHQEVLLLMLRESYILPSTPAKLFRKYTYGCSQKPSHSCFQIQPNKQPRLTIKYCVCVQQPGQTQKVLYMLFKCTFFGMCNFHDAPILCLCRFLMGVDHFCPISTHRLTPSTAPKAWP